MKLDLGAVIRDKHVVEIGPELVLLRMESRVEKDKRDNSVAQIHTRAALDSNIRRNYVPRQ